MRKDAPGPWAGFSLVELLASMAVFAILLGLALPKCHETVLRLRAASAMHQLGSQLAQARNTAITTRVPVTLCPSRGDGRCLGEPDWSAGWLLYRDPGRQEQPRQPGDILRDIRQPVHGSIRVLASSGRLRVRYQPDGRSGGNNLTLRICADESLRGEVVVNNIGRVRTHRLPANAPCPRH